MATQKLEPARLVPSRFDRAGFDRRVDQKVYLVQRSNLFIYIVAPSVRAAAARLDISLVQLGRSNVRRFDVREFFWAKNALENGEFAQ